jgi:hypothetical protein
MSGAAVTFPAPAPMMATFKTPFARGGRPSVVEVLKVAVTFRSAAIVTVHVAVPLHPPPDHPTKVEPSAGVAVRVKVVPAA